jgi:hypothetical protein
VTKSTPVVRAGQNCFPHKYAVTWLYQHQVSGPSHAAQNHTLHPFRHECSMTKWSWMIESGTEQKSMWDVFIAQGLRCFPNNLMTASWGHSGMLVLTLFGHYNFSSLIELPEVLWQQICGLSLWDVDEHICWFVCSQNPEMASNDHFTSPTVHFQASKWFEYLTWEYPMLMESYLRHSGTF